MQLARYIVEAVVVDKRSYREVARALGVSKSLVAKVMARYREGGDEAIEARSRAPKRIPHRTSAEVDAQVAIATGEVVNGSLPRRAQGMVKEWTALHRDELVANWERARQEQPLVTIDPLP